MLAEAWLTSSHKKVLPSVFNGPWTAHEAQERDKPPAETAPVEAVYGCPVEGTPAKPATSAETVLSRLPAPRYVYDVADELSSGLGRMAFLVAAVFSAPQGLASDVLPDLTRRAHRIVGSIIEFVAGRLAGLNRQDARHWRQMLRDFLVRTFARIGRAASSSRPTPQDPVSLLPLRCALTPTAPPAFAA
jgi:hypothetical protein